MPAVGSHCGGVGVGEIVAKIVLVGEGGSGMGLGGGGGDPWLCGRPGWSGGTWLCLCGAGLRGEVWL